MQSKEMPFGLRVKIYRLLKFNLETLIKWPPWNGET
jgi:hypothetical protein